MIEADATPNKSKLGANAILSVSLAVARAAAANRKLELYQYLAHFFSTNKIVLPVPLINVINGGKHASNSTDIQEYMLVPYGFSKFSEALRGTAEVFQKLKQLLLKNNQSTAVGDEGGFVPQFKNNEEPLQILVEAISEAGYVPGEEFGLAIDSAASEFLQNGKYNLLKEGKSFSAVELAAYYRQLTTKYPLVSLEDHFAEDDWQGFIDFEKKNQSQIQTIGDDLYVTKVERLKKGIATQATNAILIKPNQVGTLTETIAAIKTAKEAKMQVVVSHRSGETEDSIIADLVVAAGTGQIKSGSVCRSERLAKYNRLLEIENNEENSQFFNFPFKIQS
jgi:enolase